MADLTQANTPFRVETVLGPDVLLLSGLTGFEALSTPFRFQLDLLSEDPNLEGSALLRTGMLVRLLMPDGEERLIHGRVSRFAQLGMKDELAVCRAEIVPWIWFLGLSRESRIHQDLTVPDIIEGVFQRLGYADVENRLIGTYPPRTFCVQYRESHLAFVSRLMEEEGIFYFFEHREDKHILVLTDYNASSSPSPGGADTLRFATDFRVNRNAVSELEREDAVHPGRVMLSDYDYLQPSVNLDWTLGEESEEVYDFPGRYSQRDEGERLARLALETEEVERQRVKGVSNAPGLAPGHHFTLRDHFRRDTNAKYLVSRVQHRARAGDYRTVGGEAHSYTNQFECIPHDTPYRPRRTTPRPAIHGSQTALVVGPAGEEVYVDEYGRIKVQFYWDREGQKDENSSCWIRVATPWGGKGYGSVSVPRIGNEVVVAFEEGDPDRPLVLASVYNADQMPPFALPGAGIQMGMKSRSSPGGGGANEITMTDTKGSEAMTVHAQHNLNTTVENNEAHTVVGGTQTVTVKGDTTLTVQAGKRSVDVTGGDYQATSSAAVKLHGRGAGVEVTGDAAGVTITGTGGTGVGIDGTPDVQVTAAAAATVRAPAVTLNGTTSCQMESPAVTINATTTGLFHGPTLDIGTGVVTIHGSSIVLSAGGGAIEIGASGVTINGGTINISGGMVNVLGGMVKIN